MIHARRYLGLKWIAWLTTVSLAVTAAGCRNPEMKSTDLPAPYEAPKLIAVAPALNFSGSSDFDPVKVADLFTSELTMVEGIQVVGVNRVMAVLSRQGTKEVTSPGQALAICEEIGCDGIVVLAITEYDPYTPVVGMAAQLYMPSPGGFTDRLDPVAASRQSSPFAIEVTEDSPLMPRAQVQRVYNAAHNVTADRAQDFAEHRSAEGRPLGWRRYLKSQKLFLRFCCWLSISEMMGQEYHRMMADATGKE